jgi:hypothetical protein
VAILIGIIAITPAAFAAIIALSLWTTTTTIYRFSPSRARSGRPGLVLRQSSVVGECLEGCGAALNGVYWAVTTMTTVGYGYPSPRFVGHPVNRSPSKGWKSDSTASRPS